MYALVLIHTQPNPLSGNGLVSTSEKSSGVNDTAGDANRETEPLRSVLTHLSSEALLVY